MYDVNYLEDIILTEKIGFQKKTTLPSESKKKSIKQHYYHYAHFTFTIAPVFVFFYRRLDVGLFIYLHT